MKIEFDAPDFVETEDLKRLANCSRERRQSFFRHADNRSRRLDDSNPVTQAKIATASIQSLEWQHMRPNPVLRRRSATVFG